VNSGNGLDHHQNRESGAEEKGHLPATNNRSERNLRREAEVRKGGRTSKTQSGAQRRSIISIHARN
jgi:hypothetical protein